MGAIRTYRAYGQVLSSELELPELETTTGTPRWRVSLGPLARLGATTLLGSEPLYDEVEARLVESGGTRRIVVDDTGEFELSGDGSAIRVAVREGASPEFVRAHLLGRVLSTAMHAGGWLPLHASAVATRDGAVGLIAPKGFGKSTLAAALAAAGARVLTDDTLPIVPGEQPLAQPGVRGLRLRDDALVALRLPAQAKASPEGKRTVRLGASPIHDRATPLRALYLLDSDPDDPTDATREIMSATLAAITIVAHVKIGQMLGPTEAAPMLERAANVARTVPLHRLRFRRDLGAIGAVAARMLDWHGGPPT